MSLRVENLRCFRDPNFQSHDWHAGHITKLAPEDPREMYKSRERRKAAGRRTWHTILTWEKYWGAKLSSTQRHMLYVFMLSDVLTQRLYEYEEQKAI